VTGCTLGKSDGRPAATGRNLVQLLEFAKADGLRRAVFRNREIFRGQPFDGLAIFVLDRHRLHHQLGVGLKLDAGRRSRRLLLRSGRQHPYEQRESCPPHRSEPPSQRGLQAAHRVG
jgi:hypothetical protein